MSMSPRPTSNPRSRSASARLTATVDFPTPPLPLATARMCFTPGITFWSMGPAPGVVVAPGAAAATRLSPSDEGAGPGGVAFSPSVGVSRESAEDSPPAEGTSTSTERTPGRSPTAVRISSVICRMTSSRSVDGWNRMFTVSSRTSTSLTKPKETTSRLRPG